MIPWNATLTGILYWVGGVSSGNIRAGLLNSGGSIVASRTSDVAQATANSAQTVAFDSTYAAVPGFYWIEMTFSSATATTNADLVLSRATATLGASTAIVALTPPSSTAAYATSTVPVMTTY